MIKQKLLIFSSLLILVPLLCSAISIILLVNNNIADQSAQSIEKDARVAEQLYRNRQLVIAQAAQNTAQAITVQGLLESVQSPANLQGSATLTARIQGTGRGRLDEIVKSSLQASSLDFIVITDNQGNIIYPEVSAKGSLKDNLLFIKLQNEVAAKKLDVQVGSMKETAETLNILGLEKLSRQAQIKIGEKIVTTEGLIIEAGAPIVGGGSTLLGVVFAGLLVNNAEPAKSLADDIKKTLYSELLDSSGAVIVLNNIVVSANLPIQQTRGIGLNITRTDLKDAPVAGQETINQEVYKTAYAPIKDINSQVIGRVGVQIKDSWFGRIVTKVMIIIGLIVVFFLLVATLLAVFIGRRLTKPIIELTEASNKISLGQLDQVIAIKSDDEIGQLAEALERMRISLKQALERLRRR